MANEMAEAVESVSTMERRGFGPGAHDGVDPRSQAFFATLALEASRPHCSDAQKDLMKALLLQAETVGIYKPVTP